MSRLHRLTCWPNRKQRCQQGFTLLEVMVATLIFSMISVLIFSMLDRSFTFTTKGEERVLAVERHYGLINLVRRQVQGAWYDPQQKKMRISSATEHQFALITSSSMLYGPAALVMAFYEFDPDEAILYYTERRDFYNPDYRDEFPDRDEMIPLLKPEGLFSLQADPDSDFVTLRYGMEAYVFHPFCTKESQEFDLEATDK